ncbi:MAG TPA: S41 family peptidase [Acidobacteriaceae bacterium]|nr:S41 family peptidase [Acidobacteriaceae bacterium]
MSMSKSFKRTIFGISVVLVGIVFLGEFLAGGVSAATQNDGVYKQMGVYEEVLHKIQSDYVTEPNMRTVTVGALHGLLESLDADSSYFTPAEFAAYKAHQNEGKAQVGLDVSKRYGYATVVSVVPGSPADTQAHINDGDMIESIGGKTTRLMSLAMIRLQLEGKPGTDVTFGLIRPGGKPEPEKITLTRTAVVHPPLQVQQYENSTILYLKPGVLTRARVDQVEARLRAMPKDGNTKVLLDLRDVAEGDQAQGIRLANAFIQSGTIASVEGQTVPKQTFAAQPAHFITNAPLAVLVNNGTAGAAEIVAAAVLDHKRGDVVGSRTFGEGVEQRTITLPDGAALLLTVAKYESPSGAVIQDKAVTPNIVVNKTIDEFLAEEDDYAHPVPHPDDQLNKALEVLKQKNA